MKFHRYASTNKRGEVGEHFEIDAKMQQLNPFKPNPKGCSFIPRVPR